jgi:putative flippase GtrA
MRKPTRSDLPLLQRYIVVGLGSVVVDAGVYWLVALLTGSTLIAKPISYLSGAIFSYFGNWRFTFGLRRGRFSEVAFVLVYLSSLVINLLVNELLLSWFGLSWWRPPLAFLVSTAVTTVWNFVGQSLLVFKDASKADSLSEWHPGTESKP